MSVRCISLVLDHSMHAATDLLMLLVLADYSDDAGNSYPSVASLARKCRMQPRNATYILRRLQASGELQIRMNEGPKGANRYRIVLSALGGVQPVAGVQSAAGVQAVAAPPAIQRRKPLQPIADEPSLNRQERKSARVKVAQTPLPDGFAISEAVRRWAAKRGFERLLDEHLEHFVGWATAKGSTYANWDQAFMNAVRQDWGDIRKRSGAGNRAGHELGADEQFRATA